MKSANLQANSIANLQANSIAQDYQASAEADQATLVAGSGGDNQASSVAGLGMPLMKENFKPEPSPGPYSSLPEMGNNFKPEQKQENTTKINLVLAMIMSENGTHFKNGVLFAENHTGGKLKNDLYRLLGFWMTYTKKGQRNAACPLFGNLGLTYGEIVQFTPTASWQFTLDDPRIPSILLQWLDTNHGGNFMLISQNSVKKYLNPTQAGEITDEARQEYTQKFVALFNGRVTLAIKSM